MRAERGIDLAHTTLMRWVQHYVPKFAKHWQRYARPVERSWRIDETDIKIRGKWGYLYRGVDTEGQTIDFFLSARRDIAAATRFLQQAIEMRGTPRRSPSMATQPRMPRWLSCKRKAYCHLLSL